MDMNDRKQSEFSALNRLEEQISKIEADGGRRTRFGREVTDEEVKAALAEEIASILAPVAQPLVITREHAPHVVLVVGVNGTGKTTSTAKLAHYLKSRRHSVLLAAADTFRAAAIGQLGVWAERIGVPNIPSTGTPTVPPPMPIIALMVPIPPPMAWRAAPRGISSRSL